MYFSFDGDDPIQPDQHFMHEALREAEKAYAADEVPIGAVVVSQGRIIGRGHNLTERLNDVSAHAEMQALTAAANYLGGKYLKDCTLYVTLEPCVMCAGAIYWFQLSRLVYGAPDVQRGFSRLGEAVLHPKTTVSSGISAQECGAIVQSFFRNKRLKS
ncbi:MAG: nucleoside deaminase [Mucilaginibacter polytrichastri]|nr:nucleoside deaminase [Mucilaginibacter polytrichastri]